VPQAAANYGKIDVYNRLENGLLLVKLRIRKYDAQQ
jgi:hypothetical protein